jgi:type IV pilus assembly protein PilP
MKRVSVILFSIILASSTLGSTKINLKSRLKNFRDPFKRNLLKKTKKGKNRKVIQTYFSNKISVENIPIEDLKIVGVYLGKERRAIGLQLSKEDKAEPFIIKEGMKIGPDAVEVKAILPGGIVLVEKIINVYDEEEYLETIIPVSE